MVDFSSLQNGITVITDCMDYLETVSIKVFVNAGSRSETLKNNGIAHFLEHMAFKSTKSYSTREIAKIFDNISGTFNACTSQEYTIFYVRVLKQYVADALHILSDILMNALFLSDEIEKEKQVVMQEIAQYNDSVDDLIFDKHMHNAYSDSSLGYLILGDKKCVQQFEKQDLEDFLHTYYHGSNMMVAFAGNLNHNDAYSLTDKFFSSFRQTPLDFKVNMPIANRYKTVYKEHRDIEQVHLLYGYTGVSQSSPNKYLYKIISWILGGGFSSRLYQKIREEEGLVYTVYSYNECYMDTGLLNIYAATTADKLPPLNQGISDIIQLLLSDRPVTIEELDRAKTNIVSSLRMSVESSNFRAMYALQSFRNYGKYIPIEDAIKEITSITLDDVQSKVRDIFDDTPTITVMGNLSTIDSCSNI
ncbi:MAG: peptidase, M16 family [Candidatus Xenolissoclinum pacificiensis L6]|uniref:Peptidase, M16 family n=1 Tax=Candidatus Xenolissoclinum pacificiensis L6 TaxID=1401685 RepID=W2UZT2_9RICK|nr:MAG: peptidase, M16 family [Candidatus Xenolissoclinum pacificiensis L6]